MGTGEGAGWLNGPMAQWLHGWAEGPMPGWGRKPLFPRGRPPKRSAVTLRYRYRTGTCIPPKLRISNRTSSAWILVRNIQPPYAYLTLGTGKLQPITNLIIVKLMQNQLVSDLEYRTFVPALLADIMCCYTVSPPDEIIQSMPINLRKVYISSGLVEDKASVS